MTRWAGSGNDWIQKLARHLHRKDDLAIALLRMLREPKIHLEKKRGGIPSKKPRDLDPLVLEPPDDT